jgi:hypothetical protein
VDIDSAINISLLATIPEALRKELLAAYSEIIVNYRERRWEPSELNGGKLCEVVYTILRGYIDNSYPIRSMKPTNMLDACRALERASSAEIPRSVRIQIPRMLIALYEIRNNRGVGHTGGDVNPNHMDATCVIEMSKWILSELIRIFHNVSTDKATAVVDILVERTLPLVWAVDGKLRVLDTGLTMLQKTLTLLYHKFQAVPESDLFRWVEHTNATVFRRDVLRRAHKAKLIEYNPVSHTVLISPKGSKLVDSSILNK